MTSFEVGFVIFPNLTQLDFTGPLQVLARIPQSTIHIVAARSNRCRAIADWAWCGPTVSPTVRRSTCCACPAAAWASSPPRAIARDDRLRTQPGAPGQVRHVGM